MARTLADRVAQLEWYHTLNLPGGVVTKGFFDHRPVLDRYCLPPTLSGHRVLDVGTFDGFFAFEFERRGAREVVGLDVPDYDSLDWPVPLRKTGSTRFQPRHDNFDLAREALGSHVRREFISVYDVRPDSLGMFDLVFVGSVLIHLRDPVGALIALSSVCSGEIWIAEEVNRKLDLLSRRVPLARFHAPSAHLTWWVPNKACWAAMLTAAGFVELRQRGRPFVVPFNGRRGGVRHSVMSARSSS